MYLWYLVITQLTNLVGFAWAQMLAAYASSTQVAMSLWQPGVYVWSQTSGYPIHFPTLKRSNPAWAFGYASFTRWAYEAATRAEILTRRPGTRRLHLDGAATMCFPCAGRHRRRISRRLGPSVATRHPEKVRLPGRPRGRLRAAAGGVLRGRAPRDVPASGRAAVPSSSGRRFGGGGAASYRGINGGRRGPADAAQARQDHRARHVRAAGRTSLIRPPPRNSHVAPPRSASAE